MRPFFSQALSTTGNQITVIEKTPGNYELLGNGPLIGGSGPLIGGKVYPTGTNLLNSRFKSANIMSVTPACSNNSVTNQVRSSNCSSEQLKSPMGNSSKLVIDDEDSE